MSPPAFPIYQLMDAFEAFSHAELEVKPQHRSLYYFIIGYARRRGGLLKFQLPHESGMAGAGIGNWKTYNDAMLALHTWGFIVYTPGANRFKTPVVELQFRSSTDSPTDDQQQTYWQSYCTSIGSSTVDNKRLLDEETKRRKDLETALNKTLTEAASLRSAVTGLESELEVERGKVRELEDKLSAVPPPENNASASRTRGARRAPADEPPEFVKFYEEYPRREKRPEALAAWRKLTPEEQAGAYEWACEWFRQHPDLADPARYRFIPLPASWLNGKRWKDEAQPHLTVSHGTEQHAPRHYVPQRPVSGQKPDFRAGQMAAAVAGAVFGGAAGSDLPY